MTFFTKEEFINKYKNCSFDFEEWQIEAVCEMIYSQISLRYRDSSWNNATVPDAIKRASMEQLRFMLEYDIPFIDYDKNLNAGEMEASILTDYSTLSLRILANNGYLYRGNQMTSNMSIEIPFN